MTPAVGALAALAAFLVRRADATVADSPPYPDLERERIVGRIAHRLRSELDLDGALAVAVRETAAALGLSRCFVRLVDADGSLPIAAEWTAPGLEPVGDAAARLAASNLAARRGRTVALADVAGAPELDDPQLGGREAVLGLGTRSVLATPIVASDAQIGVLALHRSEPGEWSDDEIALAEAVGHEVGLAIHIGRLLRENERRLRQHEALLDAAQVLASELDFEAVIRRLVEEVVALVEADAADCWIFDEGGLLRCRAVHNLPESEIGRLIVPEGTVGDAVSSGQPVLKRDFARSEQPAPTASYAVFEEAMDTPIVVDGEVRGVLGLCSRAAGRFSEADLDVLAAFGNLASVALRNAEAFGERTRQARVERGFFRIAAVLGQPLSLTATLDAVAQAAGEALGADAAAMLLPRAGRLELAGSQQLPDALRGALASVDPAGTALGDALRDLRVLASSALAADERFDAAWRDAAVSANLGSLLVVPVELGTADAQPGLALVFCLDRRRFADEELELARHLAAAARGALERAALYEEERSGRRLAQQLARTAGLLATELDPAAVIDEVVQQALTLVGADAGVIRVLEGDELVVSAVEGSPGAETIGERTTSSAWLSGDVVQSRAPVSHEDAGADERYRAADRLLQLGYSGYLGVPLVGSEGSVLGVLSVYTRRPKTWRGAEVEALVALAANASAALSSAELYQQMALEKERNEAILGNVADGIVAVDRDGRVVLWNAAAERITGVPGEEALGQTVQRVLGRALEREATTATSDRVVAIPRGDGEVWLSLTEAVMRDPAGSVAGRIFAFRDISADRVVEQLKSEFVSAVSQELRRPLTSIYGFAATLLRDDVRFGDEERATFLTYIASESERLAEIVEQLLNVARLDAGELDVALTPTDIASVVDEVIASATAAPHRFIVDVAERPLYAAADPDKLRQALGNLVDNAVKYSPETGSVTIAARRRGDRVEVSVADEGVGIAESERDRIFRKFYRGEAGAARAGGTGLGLFIAQGLVAAMSGRMWVSSAEGEGARFSFDVPVSESPGGGV